MADINNDYQTWLTLMTLMQTQGDIKVPTEFHSQCKAIHRMLRSDTTGMINTILNFAVDSAADTTYKIETNNKELDKKLNDWLDNLNEAYRGKIPTGMRELAKEYFAERWKGSSLCILCASDWKDVNGILLPSALWFVDGSSVYVSSPEDKQIIKLGDFTYYLDKDKEIPLTSTKNKEIIIQKCYSRWHDKYPTPYLIGNGVLRNFLGLDLLKEKGEETLKKLLPYLLFLTKGSADQTRAGVTYDDKDMQTVQSNFKTFLQDYKTNARYAPMYAAPYDTNIQHIIPDLTKIFNKDVSVTAERSILAGLGFVSVVQGIADSRKEEVMNPKPFIAEVNSSVEDFKALQKDLIEVIIEKNKENHRKYFSDNKSFRIVHSPLKLNIQFVLDSIRQSFAYGATSIKTYQESLGLDPDTERERRQAEFDNGDEDIFFPHVIQHQEVNPDPREEVVSIPVRPKNKKGINLKKIPVTNKQIEKNLQKMKASVICERCGQSVNFLEGSETIECESCLAVVDNKGIMVDNHFVMDDQITAPYTMKNLPPAVKKLGKKLQTLWMKTFNAVYQNTKGDKATKEKKAFSIAWYNVNRKKKGGK